MPNTRPRIAPESLPAIQRRLRILRSAMCKQYNIPDTQTDFAERFGFVGKTWHNYEVAPHGRITIDAAMKLSQELQNALIIPWLYQDLPDRLLNELPGYLLDAIREVDANEGDQNPGPQQRRRAR